jgi:hypothetical protein
MMEPIASRPSPDWLGGKGLLPWSWAVERLEAERNYWLVTVRRDGFPQARPVWGVWSHSGLLLSVGHGGLQRTEMAAALPITVHVDSAVDVVIIEGMIDRVARNQYEAGSSRIEATYQVDPEETREATVRFNAKYSWNLEPDQNMLNFLVRPRVVYGWQAEDVKTATRWTFRDI